MQPSRKPLPCCLLSFVLAAALLGGCSTPDTLLGLSDPNGSSGETASGKLSMPAQPYSSDRPMPFDPYRPEGNTEEYSAIDEPGFYSAKTNPLSTFSADVDTASYCNLRRMVAEGMRAADIPNDAIRIEEMLNYFEYDYGKPQDGDLFGVTAQISECPWNDDTKLLVMGFATDPVEYESEDGANLVFLIDTSGSMSSPDKLPLLQDSFARLTESLTENDTVSIVTYSGTERVVLEGVSGADKRAITRAVDSLVADGSTNGEAGLEQAYRIAEKYRREGGVNRIVMASDGDLNVGISSESELHAYVSEKRSTGVYLSVLGFGSGNYKDNKMETLANHGNGTYHYIDCIEEAEKVFGSDLAANIIPLADDVKLQIEFDPAIVRGYRLIGYENRALADDDFTDDAVDAAEIGTGHQFTIAYELVLFDSPPESLPPSLAREEGPSEDEGRIVECTDNETWLVCSMRYKTAGSQESVERSYDIGSASCTAQPSDDWLFAAAVIECGMVLRDSKYAGTASLRDAKALLDDLALARNDPKADFERLLQTL